jgi:hypothetical protein
MQCIDCNEASIGVCGVCGKPKCSIHMVLRHYDRHTGRSVGPWPIREEGYETAGICRSCDDRQFSDAAAALAAATDPAEVMRLVSEGPPPHNGVPTNIAGAQEWHRALDQAWRGLIARGVLGQATHELLTTHVSGRNSRIKLEEVSRTAVWRAPHAGLILDSGAHFDVWVREDGELFPPSWPHLSDGGGLLILSRDVKGRVTSPDPLLIVVPCRVAPLIYASGMYYQRKVELTDGITVTSRYGVGKGDIYDLRRAVVALLKHQIGASGREAR